MKKLENEVNMEDKSKEDLELEPKKQRTKDPGAARLGKDLCINGRNTPNITA
jgi:hypothetical protein